MSWKPQSLKWPADRAVLLVHGIGNASAEGLAAFPLNELKAALGASAPGIAVYTLNYDFINDWAARKTNLAAGIATLGQAVAARYANADMAPTLAEFGGDVLWPVLHQDTRMAIHEAYMGQLDMIMNDCIESMMPKGLDPLDARVSIIAHSLGCFHTYEALHAMVNEPSWGLQPFTHVAQLESVVLMASPVQLIRSVAGDIGALVPAPNELATLNPAGLFIPAEATPHKPKPPTRQFISVTGTQDPVGGYLFGARNDWAFMTMTGQQTVIVPQSLAPTDPVGQLIASLTAGNSVADAATGLLPDPHSWSAYMTRESTLLAGVLA